MLRRNAQALCGKGVERGRRHRGFAAPVQAERAHGPDALDQAGQVPRPGRARRLAQPRDPGRSTTASRNVKQLALHPLAGSRVFSGFWRSTSLS